MNILIEFIFHQSKILIRRKGLKKILGIFFNGRWKDSPLSTKNKLHRKLSAIKTVLNGRKHEKKQDFKADYWDIDLLLSIYHYEIFSLLRKQVIFVMHSNCISTCVHLLVLAIVHLTLSWFFPLVCNVSQSCSLHAF